MKPLFNFVLTALIAARVSGQEKIRYETVFFEEKTVETPIARYLITGALSEEEVIKARIKVTNLSDKPILIKPEECSYTTPGGEMFSKDQMFVIAPGKNEAKTIDVKGVNMKTSATTLKLNGIYTCNKTEPVKADDLNMPPPDELSVGPFKLKLEKFDREGKEFIFVYRIRYMGDRVGIVKGGTATFKTVTGEFKNLKEKDKVTVFKHKEDFLVGFFFQTDSKEGKVIWNEVFSEGLPEKAEPVFIELKMDEIKTRDKN